MNTRTIDYYRDAASSALDLFRDITKDSMTETDLIVGLLHHINERGGFVGTSHAEALGIYQKHVIENALIDLGGQP